MKLKTAFQELRDFIEKEKYGIGSVEFERDLDAKIIELMEKEREQIYEAYVVGVADGQNSIGTEDSPGLEPNGHEYYFNETYTPNTPKQNLNNK